MNSYTQTYTFWNADMQAIAKPESREGLVYFKESLTTNTEQIISTNKNAFGLGVDDELLLNRMWVSNSGVTHYSYQQYYKNIKVYNSKTTIHEYSNTVRTCNGVIIKNINTSITPLINIDNIKNTVKDTILSKGVTDSIFDFYVDSTNYTIELNIYNDLNNPLIYNISFWCVELDANYTFLINAYNGNVIESFNKIIQYKIKAPTMDYDTQVLDYSVYNIKYDTFTYGMGGMTGIDTIGFICLYDSTRGDGIEGRYRFYIETVWSDDSIPIETPIYFYDTWCIDTSIYPMLKFDIWSDNQDFYKAFKYGYQSYWALQNFYDFMLNGYNYQGLDGLGAKATIETTGRPLSSDFFYNPNARYLGNSYIRIDAFDFNSLYIIGHELGHGLVDYRINMNYFDEPDVLNEGFGDIMGIVFHTYMNDLYSLNFVDSLWMGAEPGAEADKITVRPLKNPRIYNYPDYYINDPFWHDTITSGHHNSTVFSHWFYLFAQGTQEFVNSTKVNIVGDSYSFSGVGLKNAADIIIEVILGEHVQSDVTFHDMRQATIDIVMNNPNTYCYLPALLNAWDCVGVYGSTPNNIMIGNVFNNDTIIDSILYVQNVNIRTHSVKFTDTLYVMPNSNIVVESNSHLNLENAYIFFGANSGILIEQGGNLIVNNSTLTYWNDSFNCSTDTSETWNGIVYENGTLATNLDIDSSTISYAKNGIQANAIRINFTNNNYYNNLAPITISYASNNTYESDISNNVFINDIGNLNPLFLKIQNFANATIENNQFGENAYVSDSAILINGNDYHHGNKVTIKQNNFKNFHHPITNVLFSDIAIEEDTFMLTSINNPNAYDDLAWSSSHIAIYSLDNLKRFTIKNNIFKNYDLGIQTNDVNDLTIKENTFNNCNLGMYIYDSQNTNIIKNDFFTNTNYNSQHCHAVKQKAIKAFGCINSFLNIDSNTIDGLGKGMDIKLCENMKVRNNEITNIQFYNHYPNSGYGMFVQHAFDFNLKDNLFRNDPQPILSTANNQCIGIAYQNGNSGNGESTDIDFLYNAGLGAHAIIIEDAQFGLNKIQRNQIENITIGIQTQGQNTSLRMKCNTINAKFAGLLVFDELENQGISCDLINTKQYLPGNVWKNVCDPLDPNLRDIVLSPTALNYSFEYYAHAYGLDPNGGANLRTDAECNNLLTGKYFLCNGFGGNAVQIMATDFCNDINLNTGWSKTNPTEDVAILALPQEILDQLNIKQNLVSDMAVIEVQINNPETQKDLVKKVNTIYKDIVNVNSILVKLYEKNGNSQAAKNLLEQENTAEAKIQLAQKYLENEDFANASRVISDIVYLSKANDLFETTDKQTKYEDNKDYTADIKQIEYDLKMSNRKKTELVLDEKNELRNIADLHLPVSTRAEVLLAASGEAIAEHTIKYLTITEAIALNLDTLSAFNYQLSATPNPANSSTNIQYVLPNDGAAYNVQLIDNNQNTGNVLLNASITATTNYTANVSNISTGVYTIAIFRNSQQVATIQFLIAH